ncbi:epimerase [Croceicoccus estronivorus]|uniref:NAD-dependent epimerase/dehydratase family protein n=1 Tax=Croceicoccus estronivorus TaxID=1172626 RepID=UPI00082CC0BC|nr:NAD(P)-dependent oxidoreductase [Croceicoccus estronivorus]OCC25189.1 epimerase [Croceicoccus estronivorus]
MTIALTGATGFVGQTLLDEALRRGVKVRALTRREQPSRKGVTWVKGDLANRKALKALVKGVEAVVHVAGVVNAPDVTGFETGNVAGTLSIVEAAVAAGVPRFLHVSSLAAREPHLSVYGASKRRAEKIVSASGLDWTIVRPPAVYGPRDTEMLDLFRAAKWGVVPMPPPGRTSVIHVLDLARLLMALLPGGEDVTHEIFEPDDGANDGWSHHDLAHAIGWAVGRRPWVPHLSRATLNRISRIEGLLRRSKAKLTADRVGYMSHPDWVVSRHRVVPAGRWVPRVSTREGLKATADWYRREGWL